MRVRTSRAFARLAISLAAGFAACIPALAQQQLPPNVQQGLAWLQGRVQADGSLAGEPSSIATGLQARTETLHTLSLHATAPAALLARVRAETESPVESLSRRIISLAAAGDAVGPLAGELLGYRKAGSGWGYSTSFEPNALDTAFALAALKAGALASGTHAAEGLGLVIGKRNADGGWGINGDSSIYVTGIVLATLESYSSAFQLEASIASARDYLLAQRSGTSYTAAFDNASAFLALATTLGDPAVLQPLADAINASQSQNGSWGDDPYVTALALRALAGWSGGYGSLKGRVVDSVTNAPLAGAAVTLSAFGNFTTTTNATGDFSFADIRPGSHAISIAATGYGVFSGTATVRAGELADLGTLKLRKDGVQGATVRGKVRDQLTQAPLPGAAITVTVGTQGFQATSNANGDYLVADVPPGNATIAASLNGYRTTTGTQALAAGNVYDIAINLLAATSTATALTGTVRNATTGAPVAGALLSIQNRTVTADAAGSYAFDNLSATSSTLVVSATGYGTQSTTVSLQPNAVANLNVLLAPLVPPPVGGLELRGRVVDSRTLEPLADAVITAQYGAVSHATNSAADGSFKLTGYNGGTIAVTIAKAGYESGTFTIISGGPGLPNLGDFPLIPERAGSSLANLSITNINRSALVQDLALNLSGNLVVTVRNAGPNPTSQGFAVRAFIDTDDDRRFTAGIDVMLGEARQATAIIADQAVDVSIPLAGALAFRDAPIHVWVDSGQEVVEGDEDNNVRSSAEFCRQCQSATTLPPLPTPPSLTLGAEYAAFYKAYLLGPLPGVPSNYGFALPKRGDSCTVYFGGAANGPAGKMYAVRVLRDENSRIVSFVPGATVEVATAPYNDGGAIYYGPDNHLLVSQWPVNNLGIYKEGQTAPGKVIALGVAPYNVVSAHAAIQLVPEGFPGAGSLKLVSWSGGQWYTGTMRPDGLGYLEFATFAAVPASTIVGGPEGFVYVPKGSPAFGRDGMIVSEYSGGRLSSYDLDAGGNPIPATRRLFLNGVSGAEGAAIDPVTGDYIFTTFGGLNQAVIVRGFNKVTGVSDLTTSRGAVTLDSTGRVTSIAARVGNAGPEPNAASSVSFHALRNGAAAEKLGEVPIASLASGTYVDVSFTLPTATTLPGVIAIVDAARQVPECNEDNNAAAVPVEPLLGIVDARTAESGYFPGSNVAITTTVMNPGATTKSYSVALAIVDASGVPVQELGHQNVNALVGGATASLAANWVVPNVTAGTYVVRATLFNIDGLQIGVDDAPFEVRSSTGSAPTINGTVTLDRGTYGPRATVQITARVSNDSTNAIVNDVTVRETIIAPDGSSVFTAQRSLAQVAPGTMSELAFPAALPNVPAGNYLVQQELLDAAGVSLGVQAARFIVESSGQSGDGLLGTLTAPDAANQGDHVALAALVRNQGNEALAGLSLTIRVVDPDTAVVVHQQSVTYSIGQGGQQDFTQAWDTSTSPPATYVAALSATVGGGEIGLAQASIRLGKVTPFAFAPKVDVAPGSVQASNAITIAGILVPAKIGISGGEYSVDGGAFVAAEGSVGAGAIVIVRTAASASTNTKVTATLAVANFSAPFDVTTLADVTPDPFAFAPVLEAPVATLVPSNAVTIAGIDIPVPMSIANGEYSVNGGPYTAADGMVRSGDVVTVRVMTAAAPNTPASATLTVSGVSGTFTATTISEDRAPDPFTFAPRAGVPVITWIVSDPVSIAGINRPVTVHVGGGEYSINGGPFTAADASAVNGDVIRVRVMSSASFAATTSATLTVSQASATFSVTTKAAADVGALPTFSGDARVLLLLACRAAGADPNEDCTPARRAFLDGYLTDAGVEHRIVDDVAAFQVELRSGRYNTYWVSGWGEKLKGLLMDELVEAVFRGETLVVDGAHDERNNDLDAVVGVTYQGKPTAVQSAVTLSGAFLPAGRFDVVGNRAIRVQLAGGTSQARFDNGDAALVTSGYGFGRGLLFAFDLASTLAAQPASPLLRAMLLGSLDHVAPAVPAAFTAGAYVPLSISLANREAVPVTLRVTAPLPAGFALAAGAPPATVDGSGVVTWMPVLAAGATQVLDWAVRLPQVSGTYAIPIVVEQLYGSSAITLSSQVLAIEVRAAAGALSGTVIGLRALALTVHAETKARDDAVALLESAQALGAQARHEEALAALLAAAVTLDAVTSVPVRDAQAAIDLAAKEVSARWWSALPACAAPASLPCRTP